MEQAFASENKSECKCELWGKNQDNECCCGTKNADRNAITGTETTFIRTLKKKNYELTDHLGNVRSVITDMKTPNGSAFLPDATTRNYYYPFGMERPGMTATTGNDYRFGYNGKEKMDDIYGKGNALDFGARINDTRTARWFSTDPEEQKSPGESTYSSLANSPIVHIDPDGKHVRMIFDKSSNTLRVTDLDNYKFGVPEKIVSWKDYQIGGLRDKDGNVIANQVLEINDVFSGGKADPYGTVTRNLLRQIPGSQTDGDPELPVPNGVYEVLSYEKKKDQPKYPLFFRLDLRDDIPLNNNVEVWGSDDNGRGGFLLHPGTISHGCITINHNTREMTTGDRDNEYTTLTNILRSTSSHQVKTYDGAHSLLKKLLGPLGLIQDQGAERTNYGILQVTNSRIGVEATPDITNDQTP